MDFSTELPLYELFLAAFIPIGKVLFVAVIGASMGVTGIIDSPTAKKISLVVLRYLLPSLMASKIGSSIKWENLKTLWIFPVAALVHVHIGLFISIFVSLLVLLWKYIAGNKKDLYNFSVASPYLVLSCSHGNCGYLPLSMIDAIVGSFPWLRGTPGVADYGEVLISIYLIVFSPSFWLVAIQPVKLLYIRYMRTHEFYDNDDYVENTEKGTHCEMDEHEEANEEKESSVVENLDDINSSEDLEEVDEESEENLLNDHSSEELVGYKKYLGLLKQAYRTVRNALGNKWVQRIYSVTKSILSPPFIGVAVGLTSGLIPPVHYVFFSNSSPFKFIMEGLSMLGQASLPLSLIILGFSQYHHMPFRRRSVALTSVPRASHFLMILYVFVRLVLISSINTLITLYIIDNDYLPNDNMLKLVLLLEGVVPSALGLQILSEITTCEREVSAILFWNYIFGIFTLMFWLGFFAYALFIRV